MLRYVGYKNGSLETDINEISEVKCNKFKLLEHTNPLKYPVLYQDT